MSWSVELTVSAHKQLRKVPPQDRKRIVSALKTLELDPYQGDIAWIDRSNNTLRRRVGNWRIFFCVDQQVVIVTVIAIKRRGSNTYS